MATRRALESCLLLAAFLALSACESGASGELVAVFHAEEGARSEGTRGDFFVGRTQPGRTHTARLLLKNVGDAAIALQPIEVLGGALTAFDVHEPDHALLEPGAEVELEVRFSPPREGRFVSAIRVNTVAITLIGVAERTPTPPQPDLVLLSGDTLAFGQVPYFPAVPAPVVRRVWVANRGTEAVTLQRASVRALDANTADAELEVRLPNDTRLSAHANDSVLPVELRLTPASLGHKRWQVTLSTDDPNAPEHVIEISAEAVTPSPCHLTIRTPRLDFGIVFPPSDRELEVEIVNDGAAPSDFCSVWDVQLTGETDPGFLLPYGMEDALVIGPGDARVIPVRFSEPVALPGAAFERLGLLTFRTSAEARPSVEVPLRAQRPATGCLSVAPIEADFGVWQVGCPSSTRTFHLYNRCSDEVRVTGVRMLTAAGQPAGGANCSGNLPCPEFLLVSSPAIPVGGRSLLPGEVLDLQVKYSPIDLGTDSGAVGIETQVGDLEQTHVISLFGGANTLGLQADVFAGDPPPKSDFLFVIDDSASMASHQASLASNLAAWLQYEVHVGGDFRVAVVSATASASSALRTGPDHPEAVLTPSTPDLEAQFTAKVAVGTGGTGGQRCLERAVDVLLANPDFSRPNTPLSVVCITDSADVSPLNVSDYVNALWGIVGENRKTLLDFNAIGGFGPGCPGDNGRLANAVALTNGVQDAVCTPDWSKTLEWLTPIVHVYLPSFFLSSIPDLGRGPIVLTVEGQTIPPIDAADQPIWQFDAITNSVSFIPWYVPSPDRTLVITYPTSCRP